MARELPIPFIRWAARAIMEWPGCPNPGAPVIHIHGDRDWVIPMKRVRADRIIRGGMHVLNMSHPSEVNAFIAEAAGLTTPPSPSAGNAPSTP
jgi:pimeloyl-ACP methyl ester carboxylesterase